MALVYGHGAEDLDMIRRHEKVREVAGYDTSGASVPVELRKMGFLTDPADAGEN